MYSNGKIINGIYCFYEEQFMYNGDGETHYIVAIFKIKCK